jgi:hypothetical protein
MGKASEAAARAREFLRRWRVTDPGQRDRVRAERLIKARTAAARAT